MNYSNHTDGHVDSHGGYDTDGRYDTDSRFTRDAYVLDRENIPYDRYFPESSVPPRLRHQVLVDGRLVDSWTERVEGTRWEQVARDFDAESRCPHQLFPSRPLRHPFEEVLDWLEGLVGGPQHLDALDTVALTVPARPVLEDPWQSDQLDAVESLLDSVAVKLFGGDAQPALRQGLLHVWDDSPDLVLHPKSTAHTAGGICWAVGRANGWFHPHTNLRQKDLQRHLWLKTPISSAGGPLLRALRDLGPRPWTCPADYPDLLAVGHADLLTASTRLKLIGWRDKANAARDAYELHSPDERLGDDRGGARADRGAARSSPGTHPDGRAKLA